MKTDNESYQNHTRKKQKDVTRQQKEDLQAVLASPAGRRVVYRVMEEFGGVHSPSFTGDAAQTFHLEGRRYVGLTLMVECQNASPDDYNLMIQEQVAELESKKLNRKAAEAAMAKDEE